MVPFWGMPEITGWRVQRNFGYLSHTDKYINIHWKRTIYFFCACLSRPISICLIITENCFSKQEKHTIVLDTAQGTFLKAAIGISMSCRTKYAFAG